MASGSFFTLLDDIAVLLDDIAAMTKAATKKTAGVLGDDLALNAEQVSNVSAKRELPVVFAVFKGAILNKIILVPVALAISYFIPWLIIPLLMIGGAYLCFEGFEKVYHRLFHTSAEDANRQEKLKEVILDPTVDMVKYEKEKIKGAIRTDFILSAEIIAIVLGVVSNASFLNQVLVISIVAIMVTIVVYGSVGLIVKIDDIGLWMFQKTNQVVKFVGQGLMLSTPYLMKGLSLFGTLAMFLVGGGIIAHGIPVVHHFITDLAAKSSYADFIVEASLNGVVGLITGAIVLMVVTGVIKIFKKK